MFVGLRDTIYVCGVTSEEMVYAIDTNIHHVEHWGSISENEREFGYQYGKDEESPPPDVKNTEYYKEVVGYGKQCQRMIDWKFENTLHHPDLGGSALFILSFASLKQTSQLLELANQLEASTETRLTTSSQRVEGTFRMISTGKGTLI